MDCQSEAVQVQDNRLLQWARSQEGQRRRRFGNYFDVESGEEFWISGIKKNGEDRHWAGSGLILVEASVVEEYLAARNLVALDRKQYEVTQSIIQTDIAKFKELENQSDWPSRSEEDG